MTKKMFFTSCFVILNVISYVNAGCTGSVNRCEWTPWEAWSECSRTCGGGMHRRARHFCCKSGLKIRACMADCGMDYDQYQPYFSENEPCNENCINGGVFQTSEASTCKCTETYHGVCCGKVCPEMENCKRRHCSSSLNTKCLECNFEQSLFKRNSGDTACDPMCAWNNNFCWPGQCVDGLTTGCICATGFRKIQTLNETTCQPTKPPTFQKCNMQISDAVYGRVPSTTTSADCQKSATAFVNFRPSSVQFEITSTYTVNIEISNRPDYISESFFGVTDTALTITKRNISGSALSLSTHKLLADSDSGQSATLIHHDIGTINLSSIEYGITNGESLCIEVQAYAGGYLKSKNLLTQSVNSAVPYQKVKSTQTICYMIDDAPPIHCQENGKCNTEPLHIKQPLSRSKTVEISFIGWMDPVPIGGTNLHTSFIKSYLISVYNVPSSERILKVDQHAVYTNLVNSSQTSIPVYLASDKPRLYCIKLRVEDNAGNVRQARRFLLHDNTSTIEVNKDDPLIVSSASSASRYTWQSTHGNICLEWRNHFFNTFYRENKLLNPIESDENITGIYDQNTGIITKKGLPNVNGIVKYLISWKLNDDPQSSSVEVPDILNQSYCSDFTVMDGQTYEFTIRPVDIIGNTYQEKKKLYIDMSVPHVKLRNVSVDDDKSEHLFLHYLDDRKLEIEFEGIDPHSGVFKVEWSIGTSESNTKITGGELSIRPVYNTCNGDYSTCYCPMIGVCELYNYTIEVNAEDLCSSGSNVYVREFILDIIVTNHAYLVYSKHVNVSLSADLNICEQKGSLPNLAIALAVGIPGGVVAVIILIIAMVIIMKRKKDCTVLAGRKKQRKYHDQTVRQVSNITYGNDSFIGDTCTSRRNREFEKDSFENSHGDARESDDTDSNLYTNIEEVEEEEAGTDEMNIYVNLELMHTVKPNI